MPTTITSRPTEAFLGGSKRFKCQVIGNPRPTIRWFKDGIDITNNPRYNFDYTMEGRISMVIPNVTYKDEGCYRCRAENSEGIASTASFLMVRGSVHEQRDEIPTADVAEMEIEEVYIKKQEERQEYSESSRRRTEKKDRWKRSEVEYTEEVSSYSFQGTAQFESSQGESVTMDKRSWQMEGESESETFAKTESESGFVFEGQSMVIESQVFGKNQELLAELDSDPALKTKPIFVDNTKRPSDEMEAEDVIELVVQEETRGDSDEFEESMESEISSQDKEVSLFIDESSFEKTERSDSQSAVASVETHEITTSSSTMEKSGEITVDTSISQVQYGTEKTEKDESASVEGFSIKSSEKESKETEKKEEKSSEKKSLVEESLMSKMKEFRETREEETEELFITEESETETSGAKKETKVEEKKEKKLTEAEKRELNITEEAELRKKKREEEETALVERMKKFKQQRQEEEEVDIFSGVVEESDSTTVISEEMSSGGVELTSEGKQVHIEEFYTKETTVEGDIELSRERHKVFEFESSVSAQNFEEVTMEGDSSEMIIEASMDIGGSGVTSGDEELRIQSDIAIEEISVLEEEERLNERNRKLSELHVDESDSKVEAEEIRNKTKLSGEVCSEEISYKSEESGSFSMETEVVMSEEVMEKEVSGKDGLQISAEIETEEKQYKEEISKEEKSVVEEGKASAYEDGVAFGEKAELTAKHKEDLKMADQLEGRKAEEKTTDLEMSKKAKVDAVLKDTDLEKSEVAEQIQSKVKEDLVKADEGTTTEIAEMEGLQKTSEEGVDGVAEGVKVRPKLTAEASVGEDETLLEAVVDVKETQTDRGDLSNGLKEKGSVIVLDGVESQAALVDEMTGAEAVSLNEPNKESLSLTEQGDQSLTVSKSSREEVLSETLSASIDSEEVSAMKTETRPDESSATQRDIPGVAEGIEGEQEEYRTGLQEEKMPTEAVVESGNVASAETTEQLEVASGLGKASKDKPEYIVDASDMTGEDLLTLGDEARAKGRVLESEEREKVSALQTEKMETLVSAAETDKDLHITEELDISVKRESATVDGIAEGEKHRATAEGGTESKVDEEVKATELKEAKDFRQDHETLVEVETTAKDKASEEVVDSRVAGEMLDAEELKKLGLSDSAEKPLEITGEVTVETTIQDQPESKVDVQSSVDSMQFSSELEQKASGDVSVVSETSVMESTTEISVTTETSTTAEPLKLYAEVDVSSSETPKDEDGSLKIQAEIETESKSAEDDTKVDVDVEETPAKLELSASVNVDTSKKPDEVTFSGEVDGSEPQEEVKITSEVSVEETAQEIEEEPIEPTPSPPEVVNGPAEISVEVGETVNIQVTLSGFPAPKVSWKKGFQNIEERKNVKMMVSGDVHTLQILNTVVADAGKYKLTASNSEGRATFDVKVDVLLPKEKEKKDETEATSQRPEKTPPEVIGPAEISVEMGQTLSVEVTVKGNPAPRVSWYKDDQPVAPNYRKKTSVNGEVYVLQILNTVEADAGCYRATAVNQKGERSCDIKVTVTLPAPPPDTNTGGEDVETSIAVQEAKPDDVTVCAEAEVTDAPKEATISTEVEVSEKPVEETPVPKEITADVKVEETPKVTDAPKDVSAEAEVKAKTEVMKTKVEEKVEDVSMSISMKGEPDAKGQEESAEAKLVEEPSEPKPTPPEVVNGPAEISVEVGQTISIEVTLSGFPAPKVSWKKGFKNIEEGKNVKMTANGDVYTLQILNTVVTDAGKYKLTASNSEGRTTFDVKVDVVLPKDESKKEETLAVSQKPEKTSPEVTGPAEISVEMGQTLSVEVTVKGNPAPRLSWYKDDQPVTPNYRKKTSVNGEVYMLQILNTVEADAGCYRATAVNQKGERSCDIKVTVTLPAPPPDTSTGGEDVETSVTLKDMEPPELSTKPESQSVMEGELVTLSASVTGWPPPTVTWFKNNTLLRSGHNCKLFKQGGSHFVKIASAESSDSGNYTICVENPAGAVVWTIEIKVEAGAPEQESISGETTAIKADGETPDELFMKAYILLSDHKDAATDFRLKKGETVEVLDTVNKDKWLVRKQADKEKVCYVPANLLKAEESKKMEEAQSKTVKRQLSRKKSEDAGSSGEEDSLRTPEHLPLYVAVADYNPPDGATASLKLSEGQFVEVLDMENTEKWLVRTKPTKTTPSKQGWVPASYLEEKNAKMSRSTRETFREDIIKISNKQQEALVKRRYVLTDLLETEREYINQLKIITECFHDNMFKERNIPDIVKEKKEVIFGNLKDIEAFHSNVLLPALTNCALNPGTVGKVMLDLKDQFEKYIPYGSGRDNAEFLLSGEDVKKFLKEYNRKSSSEQVLPECLRRPIARIQEYQAVLKDILKYTCRTGDDSTDIEGAIHMLSEILRRIEDVKLLGNVEGFPGDLSTLGTLIRHGDLQMWDNEPVGKGKDRHVFLFQDKLLLTKPNKEGTSFAHKTTCELQDIQINETVPSDDRMFELWYAEPTSEKLTFQARTVLAREAWANQIREALKNLGVEETDIMPEQQRQTKGPKVPTPARKKSSDKGSPEEQVAPPGDSTEEDYLSFESLDSDVSSYHTAPEFEDGTTRPVFKKRLCRTVVKEGEKACLECTVGGIPLPTVAWQKGVYPIRSSDELRIEVQGAWNALVIPETIREDSGVYTAKATNVNGSAVCSAELTVGDGVTDQEYITAQSALSSEGEITLPAKMGQMDSCVVEEGKMARFDCNLVADPKPEIMWLKDGKILTTSKKYEVLNPREDLHSLIVHDVNKDDSGRYVCWARNEFGEAFTEAYLNIIPSAEAESDVERIAPKITKKFYDLVATNGHSAELKFKFIGSPMPHIQWYIKNKEVLPPREFDVKVEGDQCTFTLKEVSMEDAGKVIVKLTNPLGEDRCSSQLTVIEDFSKPKGLPKVAPKFITRFTDVDVNQGFEARFKAKVIGEPIPTVTWLRNGVPLKDCPRYKYEEYGEIFILIIENAEQGDAGEYTCVAKNKAGEASCKANLMVTKVAIPQVRESESAYGTIDYGRRGQLGISLKKDVKGVNGEMGPQFGYAPVFTKMIQDCDAKEGRRAEFECRAYGMPEPTAAWTHNGVPMERGERFIMSKDEDSNYHLMIKDVLPTDAGQYSCKLANFAGKASCSADLRVEALPRRDPLRLSPERGVDDDLKTLKKAILEPPSMPDQKPVLMDKTPDTVKLSWLPAHVPSKSQGAQPVMYIVESRELPTGDWRRMASMIPTTSYQAKGLNPNAEYLFRVRAENDNGMSEPTAAAVLERRLPKAKTDKEFRLEASPKARKDMMGLPTETVTAPSLPSDRPTLLDIRPESVRIQWVPVTLTGPGADYRPVKYLLEVKEIPGPWRKLASGLTGSSYFATDLNPDREYNFRVRAENKFAESEPTLPAILPKGRVVPPALPASKPYVSDIGDESLRLSWKPADIPKVLKGVSPTSYRIEVQELPKQDWQTLVSYIPDTTYRLTDLRPQQDYNFRIRAENEFGLSEPSRPFYLPRATAYPGAAVTRPDIVELEPSAVQLNWQRVEIPQFESDEEPLTYMIEGRTPSSDWRELTRGIRGTSHRLTGLELSEDYSFRVRPDSSTRGLGEPSPPMSLSRALARTRVPVSDLEVEELEPTSVRLRWDRVHIPPFDSSEEPLLYMIEAQEGPYADWRTVASGVPTTAFHLTDLRPDKDYAFRVRAETEYGISEPSPPKPLYRKEPEAPRYHLEPPKIDSFDTEGLQLSWKPISQHPRIRRAEPPKYTIEMREAPQADWRPVAAGIPDTSFRLAGLRPEQDYTFRVRAEMSRLPEPVALMTPAVSLLRGGVPPVMPSSAPTISNEKRNSLRLSWRPASLPSYLTGEHGPIRYHVEMLESPNNEWQTLATGLPDLSFEVSRLHPDREYSFRVRAQTESGKSAPTAPAHLYRKPIPHLPKAEPLLSDIRPDSVRLTWQAVDVPGKVTDFQKVLYMIEMQEPPSQTWTPFVRDIHEINHRVQNLRPDKDYVFRVRAVTDQGMSEPTMSVYLPRRAVQPRLPMAEPYISEVKVDSARLSWTPVDTPPFGAQMMPTTYRVEIQEPPNTNWQTLVRRLPTTNYLLTNLRPDKAYCLRVRAENDCGVSEPTRAVQLPRRAVAPVVPSDIPLVSDVRRGSMRLTWQPATVPSYGGSNMTLPVTYTIEAREPGQEWSPLVRRIPHTSYFLSGLKPDGDYEFRVRAESQYGLSPPGPSTALPRQLVARIPIETPEIINIEPDGRSVTLRWRRANIPSGGSSELITYVIEAQEPPSMEWSPVAQGVMDTQYRLSGLRPHQDYLFRVRAETGQGVSEPTLPVTFYRRMVSPRVPVERPQLYDLEPDAVRLSWQPTSTYQAETPLRYTVEVREPQIKKWRPIAKGLPDTSYHVTGLKPKLDYEFRVRPESDKGLLEPTPSIPLYRRRVLPPMKLVEPVIVDDEPETVRLNWQRVTVPRMDDDDEELTYMIEAQRGPTMEWQPIARNIRDTSYRVTGLGPHEDYHFRIRGESRDFGYTEPSPSLPLYRRPILPNVPISRPVIEDVDSTSVRLGWQRVHIPSFGSDDTPLTFMVESQEGPGSEWRPIARDIPDTRYVVRDLKPRHDYNFRIRGIRGPEISDPTPPLPVFRSPLQANWRPIREDFTRPSRPYFECLSIKVPPSMPIEKPILTDITGDSVGLTWRPARVPPNSTPPSYNVEIRKLPNMNWQRLAGGLTTTTYKATKLNPDRSYMFRIKAENEYGTSGSTMPASLGRPGIDLKKSYPEDEDGEDQGFGQKATPRLPMDKPSVFEESPDVFAISWAPARIPAYSKPSKIQYIIEKREPPSHDWTRVASNIADTRHTVKGLKPDKDIMFRIRAESDFGVSDPTLAASVNRRPVITIPPRTKDIEEESLMLAPSTFISGSVGTATAPRAPTGRPTISEVKDTTLELSWFPARVPAYMKQTPVTYSVEIREPPSTNWAPLVSGLQETGYTVENLKPKKDYMFRVRAENEHGASEPTLPAILERPPEPKPEVDRRMTPRNTPQRTLPKRRTPSMERDTTPLRYTSREATPLRYTSREPTPLRKGSISGLPVPAALIAPFDSDIQYGVESQQAQICLGLRGFPLPTIQWFFKGRPLENDDKYNAFISQGGEATLTINDVCLADIGEYKCNAENEQGVAVKIVQLDLADPPTFIEPLRDITIIAKNSGVLECRVDGIPYPEVKWNKDWRPLVESSRVFMDHESPDCWSLSLSSALKTDGGLYACIAENVAGKVHCVANVIVEDQAPSMTTLKYKQANIEDHFHILEEKGRGRTSIVRRVIEKSTGKEFAAKFIQVRDPGDKDLFKNELECLRLASHKNIVAIQDAYETERRLVLVSELYPERSDMWECRVMNVSASA